MSQPETHPYPTSTSTTTTNIPSPSSASFTAQSSSSPSSPPQSSSSSSPPAATATAVADQDPETVRRTLEARTAFTASLHSAGQHVSSDLRARATDLHSNEAAIQKQENELSKHTSNLAKQNEQWDKVVESARQGLKEIGDVQNWAEMIERDLLVVEEVLRLAEDDDAEGYLEEEGFEGRERDNGHHHDAAFDHSEGEGDLTEREDGMIKGKKVSQEPIEILDDMSSAASEMTGTSATSESSSDSSAKHISPPVLSDDEQQQQQQQQQQKQQEEEESRKSDGEAKQSKGWWGRWW